MVGWGFLAPASILLVIMSFVPIIEAFWMSFQSGMGNNLSWAGLYNYLRMSKDTQLLQPLKTTGIYMVVTVPATIILSLFLAVLLNDSQLKLKGVYRTCIFLPAAVSLVASAVIFRSLFAADGFINAVLLRLGILDTAYNFLGNTTSARIILMIMRVWRFIGFQMIFFLAGLQNIDNSLYEAAILDGATKIQTFFKITVPMLKPTLLFATITSLNSALQVYDESVNLTGGGPGITTMALAHYVYDTAFSGMPNFGYSSAISMLILLFVAIMTIIQMKAGDTRD